MSGDIWSRRRAMAALGIPIALTRSQGLAAAPVAGLSGGTGGPAVLSVVAAGAVGDGRADDTTAFQDTVDRLGQLGGGTMLIPPGIFRTRTVRYPYEPAVIRTTGAGTGRTIWEMAAPDQPVIALDPRDRSRRSMGARFEAFTVRAHPAGRAADETQIAIDCVGFSDVVFDGLQFRSNGAGSVGSWFHTAATPQLSYHQRFRNLVCEKNVGPGRVIRTANAGTAATNTNLILIEDFWVYANSGMEAAFDLSHATTYTVRSGLIESSSRDGIRLGNAGIIESVWIEDVGERPLVFAATAAGTASHNIVRDVYLSGFAGEVRIPRDCAQNILTNVTGGDFTVRRDDPLGGNILVNAGAPREAPRIVALANASGRLREVQAYRASGLGERWNLFYEFIPGAAGTAGLRVVPPRGSHLSALQVSALALANGTPRPSASGWPIGDLFVTSPDTQPVAIVVQLALE